MSVIYTTVLDETTALSLAYPGAWGELGGRKALLETSDRKKEDADVETKIKN